jgi:rhodanese-related sulfurtransferase
MRKHLFTVLLLALIPMFAVLTEAGEKPAFQPSKEVPNEKQTSLALYATSKEGYDKWKADPKKVKILDVRTPEEYIFIGHADMAWNIPVAFQSYEWDARNKYFAIKPNVDFVSQVKEWAKPTDTILVMCRSGGRSAVAVNLLVEAGFTNVYNVIDGMEGDKVDDPESIFHGKMMKNGWKNSGLPWTYDLNPERMRLPKRQ